ncbi:hypothetical protein, variant [Sphaeroforma arctica JP610]|nr:hypothetical protein, variant [Sphaeroforma arctica JP610]KNC86922.1 hypothetical protein, variant [Sphaeroforma arctica JP610]|eukprot:XP_014160825.1 hypothetical protein, variant [Sphaeroforma arctica JP610]
MNPVGMTFEDIDRLVTHTAVRAEWFHCFWAGVDGILSPGLKAADRITLTNSKSAFSESLGEYAVGALLHFAKKVPLSVDLYRQKKWEQYSVSMLKGKSLGIVGYGSIGREVAKRAKYGFGMKIVAVKRRPEQLTEEDRTIADQVCGSADDALIANCDYIVSALPGTAKTHHFWNTHQLMKLKKDCVFVNIGRGNSVNEQDLYDVMKSGHLKGIALDVFEKEPLPDSSPLYQLGEDKALLTCHCVDRTDDYWELTMHVFMAELNRYVNGGVDALQNVVSKEEGY